MCVSSALAEPNVPTSPKSDFEFDCVELAKLWNLAKDKPCGIQQKCDSWEPELRKFVSESFAWEYCLRSPERKRDMAGVSLTDPGLEPDYPGRKDAPYVVNPTNPMSRARAELMSALISSKFNNDAQRLLAEFESRKAEYEASRSMKNSDLTSKSKNVSETNKAKASLGTYLKSYALAYQNLRLEYGKLRKYENSLLNGRNATTDPSETSKSQQSIDQMYRTAFADARTRFEGYVGKDVVEEFISDLDQRRNTKP